MFRSHILNLSITNHHLHCLISGQISSLFISLIKSLNFAGLLEYFVIISLIF